MFSTFINTLNTWIEKNNKRPALESFSCHHCNLTTSPPDLLQIKRSFLRCISPAPIKALFQQHPNHLKHQVDTLFQFTTYITDSKLKSRIESSVLATLSDNKRNRLYLQVKAFLGFQNKWSDGSWHTMLINEATSGLQTICQALEFSDEWICARFLAECGYQIPFSHASAKGWQKWSGEAKSDIDFHSWWQHLLSYTEDNSSAFDLDRWLDCLFNDEFSLLDQALCINRKSCIVCPLQKTCHFFKHSLAKLEENADFLNKIKTGDCKHLTKRELLKLLADTSWFDTELQNKLTEEFPNISHNYFSDAVSRDEEKVLATYLVVKELLERTQEPESPLLKKSFTNAKEIYNHFKQELRKDTQESFYVVSLDVKHRVISKRLVSLGTLNQSLVHPREVFAAAIQLRAAAIILVHNHPSGDPAPSNQDLAITQRLKDVGDLVGIKVLDHIIIGADGFFSFVDDNLLKS